MGIGFIFCLDLLRSSLALLFPPGGSLLLLLFRCKFQVLGSSIYDDFNDDVIDSLDVSGVEKAAANCGMHSEQRTAAKNKDCREIVLASLEVSWDRRFLVLVRRRWSRSLLIIVLELCCVCCGVVSMSQMDKIRFLCLTPALSPRYSFAQLSFQNVA
jgi:hypothetical protein